jgi:hypothetical protein
MNSDYPLNPDYGKGLYRRRILLRNEPGGVIAELEDCNHGFRVRVSHDGETVTAVEGEALRVPMTTCPGAVVPLRALAGIALGSSALQILKRVDIRSNCTHLYDLSLLAIAQAHRGTPQRQYDVVVHDQTGKQQPAAAEVYRDQQLVHRWLTRDSRIVEPGELKGNTVMQGFTFWANRRFQGDDNEAAFVLQKGLFVAAARILDMSRVHRDPATAHTFMHGACYSYSSPQLEQALRLGDTVRDFTHSPEQLLKFLPASHAE